MTVAIETPDERAARVQKELDAGEKRWRNPKTRADMEEGQRAREELYAKNAPSPQFLDRLERERMAGRVGMVRQESPGIYTFVDREHDTGTPYLRRTLRAIEREWR